MADSPFDNATGDELVEERSGGAVLRIRVRPRAARKGVLGTSAGMLTVGVGAPPEGGKATAEAIRVVAGWLDIAPSRVTLVSGATSRSKRLRVTGASAAELRERLAERLRAAPRREDRGKPAKRP